jgi:hypothetical protein
VSNLSKHPSNQELLIHFHETVLQYDSFMEVIPLKTQQAIPANLPPLDVWSNPDVAKYCIRASLLRKYWASREELRLDKITTAMQTILDESADSESQQCHHWSTIIEEIEDSFLRQYPDALGGKDRIPDHTGKEQEYNTVHHLVSENLYGTLMHGDYQKWINVRGHDFANLVAISTDVAELEGFIHKLYDICEDMFDKEVYVPDYSRIERDSPEQVCLSSMNVTDSSYTTAQGKSDV